MNRRNPIAGSWLLLLGLLWLSACCVEEPSTFVFIPPEVDEMLSRACRLSANDYESMTIDDAVETYHSHLTYDPNKRCIEYPGTICEFGYPCDKPPDMSGARWDCPLPPPPRRYYACFGCGSQPIHRQRKNVLLLPNTSALLDLIVRETGVSSREEALRRAIAHYEQNWIEERKLPDFYQHKRNIPRHRKPDQPCWDHPPFEHLNPPLPRPDASAAD